MKYLSFNQRFKTAKKFVFSQILSCFHLKKLQPIYKTEVDFSLFPLNNICTFQYCLNLLLTCIFWWSQIINTNCIFLRHNQLLQFILQSFQLSFRYCTIKYRLLHMIQIFTTYFVKIAFNIHFRHNRISLIDILTCLFYRGSNTLAFLISKTILTKLRLHITTQFMC